MVNNRTVYRQPAPRPPIPSNLRIALYSHDTMGLGHKRRTLLIAQALRQSFPDCSVLLISGMTEASRGDLAEGIDYLTLPAWQKTPEGTYQARRLRVPSFDLAMLRAKTIRAALETFNPDVFIVDNVPRGAMQELDLALEFLRRRRQTRCILGLRDVLDDPATVRRQWKTTDNEGAIRRYYDAVWIYGDPAVYDLAQAYRFPADIAAKVRYVGYLDAQTRLNNAPDCQMLPLLGDRPLALAMVGGGQDGAALATAFAQADLPPNWQGLLITGPLMAPEQRQALQAIANQRPNLTVMDYCAEPTPLIQRASAVVAMGGYNTTCEILSLGARALIVPRTRPRREQWIRAKHLQYLGLVDVLDPDDLDSAAITTWLSEQSHHDGPKPPVRDLIDLNGLDRLPHLLTESLPQPLQSPTGKAWWPRKAG